MHSRNLPKQYRKKSLKREKERKSAAIASGTGSARNSRVGGVNKAALAEKYREPDIQHFAESGSLCFKDYLFDLSFFIKSPFLKDLVIKSFLLFGTFTVAFGLVFLNAFLPMFFNVSRLDLMVMEVSFLQP